MRRKGSHRSRRNIPRGRARTVKKNNGANLGFKEKLWAAADKMRGNMDPGEYKHVALGLIFLKYISDAFEQRRADLAKEKGSDPEDRDEYLAENIFWVPKQARWKNLQANAKQPTIGKLIDDAVVAIEKENPSLKGVLPKDYVRSSLDKHRLGEMIDLIGTIGLAELKRSEGMRGRWDDIRTPANLPERDFNLRCSPKTGQGHKVVM